MDFDAIINKVVSVGIKVAIALAILFISFKLINLLAKKLEEKLHKKSKIDKTIFSTATYAIKILLKILVVVCLIGYLGIDTSGITALIASLGVGFGLAVNGALSNLAGGVLLLVTRPFKIDDYIEAEGVGGTVEDIRITFTRLRTPDNKVVYIPNGKLSADTIVNYSEKPTRRLDLTFSVAYGADLSLAMEIISRLIKENPLALADPEPSIKIANYADSAVEIIARPWVSSNDYWQLKFELLEAIGREFRQAGIEIPYNQLDVHIKND
ncbi:MAG: mechanosensitive ion channel [Clostridia bacterium]|nr:mechanosensitive ion channel [Clostridia bacterium]